MRLNVEIESLIEYNQIPEDTKKFSFLYESNEEYYINQLNKLNSNLINNFAKCLICQYHYDYYKAFDEIIQNNVDREEYDYYNMNFLDRYLNNIENNIEIYTNNELNILKSMIKLSQIFLENAVDIHDFELLLSSFFQLKDKIESNNFFKQNNPKIFAKYIDDDNLFDKNDSIIIDVGGLYVD